MAFRTSNPALKNEIFSGYNTADQNGTMTIQGTVNKTTILLACAVISASYTWSAPISSSMSWTMVGAIGGFITALITMFRKQSAGITAPLYAILEGLFLGGISRMYEQQFNGIVFNAIILTFGTLFTLLAAYKTGMIKVTDNFRLGIVAATGGIAMAYFINFILGMFGIGFPFLHSNGPIGIAISLGIVIIAALNLVLDFDFIEQGANNGAPKYMEWYASFGLMVTLVWLYLEILRLLSKLQDRR